jgi:hypothetical protein
MVKTKKALNKKKKPTNIKNVRNNTQNREL